MQLFGKADIQKGDKVMVKEKIFQELKILFTHLQLLEKIKI